MRICLPKTAKILFFIFGSTFTLMMNMSFTNYYKSLTKWMNINHGNDQNFHSDSTLLIINCSNKPLMTEIKRRGEFWIFYNFVRAENKFNCDESITYATPATYQYLDNLPTLVDLWQGPISVALYAPGYDFDTTLEIIAYLRNCETENIRKFVTFHLFFEAIHLPIRQDKPLVDTYNDKFDCEKKLLFARYQQTISYKTVKKLLFPINIARNVARETAQTYFILSSDIELYPTPNLIESFLQMLIRRNMRKFQRKVFVLPVFEIKKNETIPITKKQLRQMYKWKRAIQFHANICSVCHKVINLRKWLNSVQPGELDVFAKGKRILQYRSWEPTFIGTNDDPFFDERMTWEGRFDKMSQAYTLCLLNYDFLVLNNAFLIHRPGIKLYHNNSHDHLVKEMKNFLIDNVKEKLIKIYGKRRYCAI